MEEDKNNATKYSDGLRYDGGEESCGDESSYELDNMIDPDWKGAKYINSKLLKTMSDNLNVIHTVHLPLVKRIAEDVTVPVYELRELIDKWSGKFICGNRYHVVKTWYYMVETYLLDMKIHFNYHDMSELLIDHKDITGTQYICPISKTIESDWWITDTGDSLTGAALKGLVNSGRTIVHPITGRAIGHAFLNREKMLMYKDWAEKNYPDLNDIYNDMYIYIPECSDCAVSFYNGRYDSNAIKFIDVKSLLLKGRSRDLPLSVLIDPSLNHEYTRIPNLPIIIKKKPSGNETVDI
jgi:hypothetical protein